MWKWFLLFGFVWARGAMDYYPEERLCAMVRAQEREEEYGNKEYAKQLAREIEDFRERFGLQWYNEAYCGSSDSYEDGFRDGYYYGTRPYPTYPTYPHYQQQPPHKPHHHPQQTPPHIMQR